MNSTLAKSEAGLRRLRSSRLSRPGAGYPMGAGVQPSARKLVVAIPGSCSRYDDPCQQCLLLRIFSRAVPPLPSIGIELACLLSKELQQLRKRELNVIPQEELDRFALVKNQAEFISREGFPELGYSVLQQGFRRLEKSPEPWQVAVESMWREAIREHCEFFSIVEPASEPRGNGIC